MANQKLLDRWSNDANKQFAGRKIVEIRWLNRAERDDMGWYASSPVLILDNGDAIFASADDEGNGPGALFTNNEKMPVIPVI